MNSNLTDITMVVDRSGSMNSCRADAEGGINAFIEKQKSEPGYATFSLIQFDTEYNFTHRGVPIRDVGHYTLTPRGGTALLDAVGRAIVETGDRLKLMREEDRPGLVVFVIITDGQENSSREYTKAKIKWMIEHQAGVYKWQFLFLGANQDAFEEAGSIGINALSTANYSQNKTLQALAAATGNVTRMRCATSRGLEVDPSYTAEEVQAMA